jgi:hypothetical protein
VLSNDDNFAYFAALAVPHPVSFVINATWNDGGTSVTRNVTGAGNIISSESFIGDDAFTRRSISANSREKLRLCRAMRLSTRRCSH